MPLDVTDQVAFDGNDDECLPLTKCVCGKKYPAWDAIVSIYPERPFQCDECGAQLYFERSIRVLKVTT